MSSPRLVDVLLIVASFACLGAAFAVANLCNGGYALVLFGAAVAPIGVVLFRTGAWATAIPMAILTLTLVAGGLYGASVGGCHV